MPDLGLDQMSALNTHLFYALPMPELLLKILHTLSMLKITQQPWWPKVVAPETTRGS